MVLTTGVVKMVLCMLGSIAQACGSSVTRERQVPRAVCFLQLQWHCA
jgi:hypothetical protein